MPDRPRLPFDPSRIFVPPRRLGALEPPRARPPAPDPVEPPPRGVVVTPPHREPSPPPIVPAPAPGAVPTTPAAALPIEPPIAKTPPPDLPPEKRREWLAARVLDYRELCEKSAWDMGQLIHQLMPEKEATDSKHIKELVVNMRLGLSHMQAQKYLMVHRTFSRELAVRLGIEKCYAFHRLARHLRDERGKPRVGQGALVYMRDEAIPHTKGEDGRPLTARNVSAAELRRVLKKLAADAKERRASPDLASKQGFWVREATDFARTAGLKRPLVKMIRHDGKMRAAILIDTDDIASLRDARQAAALTLVTKRARTDPEFAKLARAKGLTIARARALA